jgi:ankyrin repeat protein
MRVLSRQPSTNPLNTNQASEYLDEDEGCDEYDEQHGLKSERYQLRVLQDLVAEINRADHIDLAKTLNLFNRIKGSEKAIVTLVRSGNEGDMDQLRKFGGSICNCISSLERLLQTGQASRQGIEIDGRHEATNTLLESLSATEVRGICNGLAAAFDESLQSTLFSKAQLTKVAAPLRKLNDALLLQAMTAGLPRDLPSNGCLLDILKMQSRLLKGKLLNSDSKYLKTIFSRSIDIFSEWAATSGKVVSEDGIVVSRQLGKVFVQLNTVRSFGLIKLDKSEAGKKNRRLLGQLAIALGSAEALDELTSKPGPSNRDGSVGAAIRVPPNGVEVTNIGNTIKDFLEAGFISIGDNAVQEVLRRLMTLVTNITPSNMVNRSAQTLGNCANLIRIVYECAIRPGASTAILQSPEFSAAATKLIQLSASDDFWQQVDWFGKPEQTLANIGSFLKAMDKWGKVDATLLRSAVPTWAMQVHALALDVQTDGASVASLLSALVDLHKLAPTAQMPALIERCLSVTSSANLGKWEARSRAQALRAALVWRQVSAGAGTEAAIDALLSAGPYVEDSLPYLQAILIRCKQDSKRLSDFEKMLRPLLPHRTARDTSPFELAEIEREIKRLEAKEPAPFVRETEPVPEPATPLATSTTSVKPAKRLLVGESENMKSAQEIASSSYSTSFKSSSAASSSASAPFKSTSGTTWNQPKKAARKQPDKPLASTEPVTNARALPVDDDDSEYEEPVRKTATAAGDSAKAKARKNPAAAVTSPAQPITLTAKTRVALEKQWFDAVRHPGLKGRMEKLIDMLAKYPDLPNQKDPQGRPALFHTITNGDKNLTQWLLERMTMPDMKAAIAILNAVFAEPVIVGDMIIELMNQFLSKLDKAVANHVARYFLYERSDVLPAYRNALMIYVHPDIPPMSQVGEVATVKPAPSQLQSNHVASKASETVALSLPDNDAKLTPKRLEFKRGLGASAAEAHKRNPLLNKVFMNDATGVDECLNHPNASRWLTGVEEKYQTTPLGLASYLNRSVFIEKILKFHTGEASALMPNRFGFTPVFLAIDTGSVEAVQALMKSPNAIEQIRLSRPDASNLTPIYMAVYTGNADMLRSMLEVPGAANLALLRGPNQLTPLQLAVAMNNTACAAELLKLPNAEMQLRVQDDTGRNVLAKSLQEKSLAVGKLLLERPEAATLIREHFDDGMNVLTYSIYVRDEKTVELLLASPYAEWLAADDAYKGSNALMFCTMNPSATSLRIAERLLSLSNAELQAAATNSSQQNALLMATEWGLIDLIRKLISLRNVNAQTKVRVLSMVDLMTKDFEKGTRSTPVDMLKIKSKSDSLRIQLEKQNDLFTRPPGVSFAGLFAYGGMNAFELAKATRQNEIAKLLQPFENG